MWLNFLLALIPIVWLIVSLGVLKISAPKACSSALLITVLLVIFSFKLPVMDTFTGALEGIMMGLWPIIYVIIATLFTYNITNESGGIKVIQNTLSAITTDKRILVSIIA